MVLCLMPEVELVICVCCGLLVLEVVDDSDLWVTGDLCLLWVTVLVICG